MDRATSQNQLPGGPMTEVISANVWQPSCLATFADQHATEKLLSRQLTNLLHETKQTKIV
jgi:hypothetical protein